MPSKSSALCSDHFEDKDIGISKKGYRYLNEKAIPTKNILIFKDYIKSIGNEPGSSRKRHQGSSPLTSPTHVILTKKAHQAITSDLTDSPTNLTPREINLIKQLRWTQSKLNKQNKKVKRLQSQNLRLNKKIKSMEEHLKSLQKKLALKTEDIENLKNTNVKVGTVNVG
ncbi:hypothetical protein HF086_016566 [Spodoptera exigua]|uniref:THAP-type domain-containing protein n=1 Tax=Spodoptera exigua TaxID=7107 RepID=A0A922M8I4_SPOEX|nr:hypothetical protein HF086_016566 [Spodoptera exigua]